MAKRTFGCTSIVNAVSLQFELAGHGLFTDLKRSKGGQWLCEHAVKRAGTSHVVDESRRDTVTPSVTADACSPFRKQWLEQAPKGLCECNQGRLPCDCGKGWHLRAPVVRSEGV